MTNTTVHYSDSQLAVARTLASAYGHGWAQEVPTEHPIKGARWTQTLIRELYTAVAERSRWEDWQWGITDPGPLGYSGAIRHVTMTGRVQWQIDDAGIAGIVICRPGEGYVSETGETRHRSYVVLSARVVSASVVEVRTPETRDHRIPDVHTAAWSPKGGPRAEARHGDALLYALTALIGPEAAALALSSAGVVVSPPVAVADPLLGFSPDEIVVGPEGQTLADAGDVATSETGGAS